MEAIRKLETERVEVEHEIEHCVELIKAKYAETEREKKHKERLEAELKSYRTNIEDKNKEVRGKQDAVHRAKDDIAKLETQMKDMRHVLEKSQKDKELLEIKTKKLQEDYEDQISITTQLIAENQAKIDELKGKEAEITHIRDESRQVNRVKDGLMKRIKVLEDSKSEAERLRDVMKVDFEMSWAKLHRASGFYQQDGQSNRGIPPATRDRQESN